MLSPMTRKTLRQSGWNTWFIALFVFQMVAVGFCALSASAHAASLVNSPLQSDCSKGMSGPDQGQASDQICSHCDMPDQAYQSIATPPDHTSVLIGLVFLSGIDVAESTPFTFNKWILAPPRSSSLIYNTTQRILI